MEYLCALLFVHSRETRRSIDNAPFVFVASFPHCSFRPFYVVLGITLTQYDYTARRRRWRRWKKHEISTQTSWENKIYIFLKHIFPFLSMEKKNWEDITYVYGSQVQRNIMRCSLRWNTFYLLTTRTLVKMPPFSVMKANFSWWYFHNLFDMIFFFGSQHLNNISYYYQIIKKKGVISALSHQNKISFCSNDFVLFQTARRFSRFFCTLFPYN